MRRRLLASLSATAAVAASLLIGSAVPATAADAAAQSAPIAEARDSGGVTPNGELPATSRSPTRRSRSSRRCAESASRSTTARRHVRPSANRRPACSPSAAPRRHPRQGPVLDKLRRLRVEPARTPSSASRPTACANDVPWLKLKATPRPGHGRRLQQRDGHPAHRHKGRPRPPSCTGNSRPWPWTTRRTTCSGRPSSHSPPPMRRRDDSSRRRIAMSGPCADRRRTQPIQLRRDVP